MSRPSDQERAKILSILGLGLDGNDGHQRITRTEEFLLMGGSQETHERMQETAIHFEESLERRGKTLAEAEVQEVIELLQEAQERTGES